MPDNRFEKIKQVLENRQPDLTVLIEDVEKPHNLAAIARTCEAIGIPEIHAVSKLRRLRLSQMAAGGIRKWITLNKYTSTESAYAELKSQNMQIVATHLSDNTIDYKDIDYTQPTAIIAGSEYEGVTEYAVENADFCISIPMMGMVQSLNVSVAMSIILYEALNQRKKAGMYTSRQLDKKTFNKKLFEWSHPKISQYCIEHNQPYPDINDQGEIIGKLNNLKVIK